MSLNRDQNVEPRFYPAPHPLEFSMIPTLWLWLFNGTKAGRLDPERLAKESAWMTSARAVTLSGRELGTSTTSSSAP